MFKLLGSSAAIAALSVVVLGLAGCGESSEEKATKKVCSATSEISTQIKKLEALPVSSSLTAEIEASAQTIDKSVGEIKSAAPDLPAANKAEFEAATSTFERELASLLATAVKSAKGGEASEKSAGPQLEASLRKLSATYQKAFENLKCS